MYLLESSLIFIAAVSCTILKLRVDIYYRVTACQGETKFSRGQGKVREF